LYGVDAGEGELVRPAHGGEMVRKIIEFRDDDPAGGEQAA
jgi:hypothetical protein